MHSPLCARTSFDFWPIFAVVSVLLEDRDPCMGPCRSTVTEVSLQVTNTMKKTKQTGKTARDLAAERLAEIDNLSGQIREGLKAMIANVDETSTEMPKVILDKLNLLHAAHLRVVVAEDKFHDALGEDPDADAIDYDAIRSEVGCRLDRIRQSLLAEGFPCDADTRAACNAALSVRLLGDAAPDRSER